MTAPVALGPDTRVVDVIREDIRVVVILQVLSLFDSLRLKEYRYQILPKSNNLKYLLNIYSCKVPILFNGYLTVRPHVGALPCHIVSVTSNQTYPGS